MHVAIFEDRAVERLGVLVAVRPASDLTIGTTTLRGLLRTVGPVRLAVRPHLARHLAACTTRGLTLWGRRPEPPVPGMVPDGALDPMPEAGPVLAVNARVVPTRAHLATLAGLLAAGRRCAVRCDGALAAAVVRCEAADDREALSALLGPEGPDPAALEALPLPEAADGLALLAEAHHVVTAHEQALADSLALRLERGGHVETRPGLFVAPGGQVDPLVAVRGGPVVVEAGAIVGPFVCLDGPVWIGRDARVQPHAWLRAGTSIGRGCRVGGEVEATVLEPFANKPHEGFLGHSHVGSWVNLAAGTITGNLKSTYGEIRLHQPRGDGTRATVHTGRQFLGALVGELVRSAVGTLVPCGARIGVAATIGGTVPDIVPPLHNMLVGGPDGSRSTVDQVATILGRMMARRGVAALPADRDLLAAVAAAGAPRC